VNMAEEKKTPEPFRLSDVKLPLCIGTWAWGGNTQTFGASGANTAEQEKAFRSAVNGGITFFDTAEIYSSGGSESLLGKFIANLHSEEQTKGVPLTPIHVATKYCPLPFHFSASNLTTSLMGSLKRLGLNSVDLFQVHGPAFSVRKVETWAEEMADCYQKGLIRSLGVSNYNSDQVRRTQAVLAKRGLKLESNQIEYSLLHRLPETQGLIKTCKDLDVKILAYSPLAMGRLTGKYSATNPPKGNRKFGGTDWKHIDGIIAALSEIGKNHGDKTPAQVALNWVIKKGCIPIAGATNAKQAEENAGATGWEMTDEETKRLDDLSYVGTASFWQGSTK